MLKCTTTQRSCEPFRPPSPADAPSPTFGDAPPNLRRRSSPTRRRSSPTPRRRSSAGRWRCREVRVMVQGSLATSANTDLSCGLLWFVVVCCGLLRFVVVLWVVVGCCGCCGLLGVVVVFYCCCWSRTSSLYLSQVLQGGYGCWTGRAPIAAVSVGARVTLKQDGIRARPARCRGKADGTDKPRSQRPLGAPRHHHLDCWPPLNPRHHQSATDAFACA
jgi:hypothetical protein